jgi:glutamyl-Q tRNA(Asp) synthetase
MGCADVIKAFKIHEPFESILSRKAVDGARLMFIGPPNEVVRNCDVQDSIGSICQDIDISASHSVILLDVDGRDKPGHDEQLFKPMPPPVFRFAPSPNGPLHLGHAYSALLNAERAARSGGRLLLRMEDIDQARCRPEFESAIYDDLAWLGVAFERPVRRQSEHLAVYRQALERLRDQGLIYPAFESRAGIARLVAEREAGGPWPRDPDGAPLYPGAAKALPPAKRDELLASGIPYALRLDMAAAIARVGPIDWIELGAGPDGETGRVVAQPEAWGDVILARKEVPTSYHLSVVIDDALQGVTEVVRGRDLFRATGVHRLLQELLDLPAPAYRHHRLIPDDSGRKLSKSTAATGLRELREAGVTVSEIRRRVGLPAAA